MSFGKLCLRYFAWDKHHVYNLKLCSFCRRNPFRSFSGEPLPSGMPESKKQTFASLFRNSSFVQMGNHHGVQVAGRIFQIQDENLYIDFGGKFHCVCKIPENSVEDVNERLQYKRGNYVIITLDDFELSARFLGAAQDTTLLEADASVEGTIDFKYKKILYLEEKSQSASFKRKNSGQNASDDSQIASDDNEIANDDNQIASVKNQELKQSEVFPKNEDDLKS